MIAENLLWYDIDDEVIKSLSEEEMDKINSNTLEDAETMMDPNNLNEE